MAAQDWIVERRDDNLFDRVERSMWREGPPVEGVSNSGCIIVMEHLHRVQRLVFVNERRILVRFEETDTEAIRN